MMYERISKFLHAVVPGCDLRAVTFNWLHWVGRRPIELVLQTEPSQKNRFSKKKKPKIFPSVYSFITKCL